MELCNCKVNLAGDRNHVVQKNGVTTPELAVLRAIHGADAVTDIVAVGTDKRAHSTELDRLQRIYNRREKVVDALFPARPGTKLPVKLAELGVEITNRPAKKGGGRNTDSEAASDVLGDAPGPDSPSQDG